jgi:hypothetical protein
LAQLGGCQQAEDSSEGSATVSVNVV